jgi:hypothetical protein
MTQEELIDRRLRLTYLQKTQDSSKSKSIQHVKNRDFNKYEFVELKIRGDRDTTHANTFHEFVKQQIHQKGDLHAFRLIAITFTRLQEIQNYHEAHK